MSTANKAGGKKKSRRANTAKQAGGAPFNELDPKRRLGTFSGAGEHPRKGGRTVGIVGQTRQRNHTDRRGKK
jgi:hypothetical protein